MVMGMGGVVVLVGRGRAARGGATALWKGNKFACPSTAWMKLIAESSCCLGTTGALT